MNRNRSDGTVRLEKAGIFAILSPFRWMVMSSAAFFAAAGSFRAPRFYGYLAVCFVGAAVWAVLLARSPDLANSRGKSQRGTKKWDLFLVIPYILILILVIPLIAGLDTVRFGWSSVGWGSFWVGAALYALSWCFIEWAMHVNHYFEGTVRIQTDRDHHVITHGPYRYVRHPGYAGMLVSGFSLVLMLGSLYALIPLGVSMILLVTRTALEDRTLQLELEGYREYTEKTRYRLIPLVW